MNENLQSLFGTIHPLEREVQAVEWMDGCSSRLVATDTAIGDLSRLGGAKWG